MKTSERAWFHLVLLIAFAIFAFANCSCSSKPKAPDFPPKVSFEAVWSVRERSDTRTFRVTTDGVNSKAIFQPDPRVVPTGDTWVISDGQNVAVIQGSKVMHYPLAGFDPTPYQWWLDGRRKLLSLQYVDDLDLVCGRKARKYKMGWEKTLWLDAETGVELQRMEANWGTVHNCVEINYTVIDPSEFTMPDPTYKL